MKSIIASVVIGGTGTLAILAGSAHATDLRFDVVTFNSKAQAAGQLPNLNFPSVNGHIINMGSSNYVGQISGNGNTLGIYYDTLTSTYSPGISAHDSAETIEGWVEKQFDSADRGGWLVLNEVSNGLWTGSNGDDYRNWLVNLVQILKNGDNSNPAHPIPAHTGVILFTPFNNPGSTYANIWNTISQYAYIGDECYVNAPTVQAAGYSISAVQQTYQHSYNSWVYNANVPASRLILGEEFTNSEAGNGYGADGLSGADWQEAIEVRNLAIYNVGFGGFIGYAWGKNAQGSDYPTLQSYENAYASTMVVQSEVPCWTGNDGTGSWNDYLNWTGGLPSTTNDPYPLLAAANPGLPRQTTANFLNTIQTPTTITLDGNQTITNINFDSGYSYTIAPGAAGSVLMMSGANASMAVADGSHFITSGIILNNNLTTNLTGDLTLSGALITNGNKITKSGNGTLTLSGHQLNSAGSAIEVMAGTLNLESDAGSAETAALSLAASGGSIEFGTGQHLDSLTLDGGNASMQVAGSYLLTHSVSISGSSTLDLSSNDMIVDYTGISPMAAIRAELATGYDNGGGARIFSSSTVGNVNVLGYAEAADIFGIAGNQTAIFDGQSVDDSSILIKYTMIGDANLDGVVDDADLAMIAPSNTGTATWCTGDFNYDGLVNADDYSLYMLGAAFDRASANYSPTVHYSAEAESFGLLTPLPEPGICAAVLGLTALMRRVRGER
ncbi:MAG TPA: dockerin type I repeat-containing protein [Tepidisphaeraceae bacterium]|nr:dockerin type I repeat-containing protein [Tepidisphaeraceae bacterium]